MKIHEVEKALDIPKATIRFYEKEGLLHPQRNDNAYREYSQEDLELLKKIIVLRKIGVPIDEIKQMLDGEKNLQDVLSKNMEMLHEQMKEVKGAMKVCSLMQEKEENGDAFNGGYYWNLIQNEEAKGQKFFEIAKDYLQFEKDILDRLTGGGNKTIRGIVVAFIMIAVLLGIENIVFYGEGFFNGLSNMLWTVVFLSIVLFPAFLLRNKGKAKDVYIKCIGVLAAVFMAVICIFLVVLFLNSKFHFLY